MSLSVCVSILCCKMGWAINIKVGRDKSVNPRHALTPRLNVKWQAHSGDITSHCKNCIPVNTAYFKCPITACRHNCTFLYLDLNNHHKLRTYKILPWHVWTQLDKGVRLLWYSKPSSVEVNWQYLRRSTFDRRACPMRWRQHVVRVHLWQPIGAYIVTFVCRPRCSTWRLL